MNWQQFFTLLRSIFTKEEFDIVPNDENFSLFLVNRYISFAHPNLCIYIDDVMNRYDKAQLMINPTLAYKTLRAVLPKLPYTKIKFIKKEVSEQAKNKGVSDEELKRIADLLEISKREVLLYNSLL